MKSYGIIWALLNIMVGLLLSLLIKLKQNLANLRAFLSLELFVYWAIFIANNMNYVGLFILFIFYANRGYATPLLRNYINRHTESNVRATVMSIRSFIIRTSFAIIAPFIGWIADQYGLNSAFLTMASTVCILAIPCLFF